MENEPAYVPAQALLGVSSQAEILELFSSYPVLLEGAGIETLAHLSRSVDSVEQRQRFSAMHVMAWACREHGAAAVTRELHRMEIDWSELDFEGYWPLLMCHLGVTYLDGEAGQSSPDVEKAIGCFLYVIRNLANFCLADTFPNCLIDLGRALLARSEGDRATNLKAALENLQLACAASSPAELPFTWARANAALGTAFANHVGDFNLALRYYRKALKVYAPEADWENWAEVQANLASTLLRRGRSEADTEQAIKLLRAILRHSDDGSRPVPAYVLGCMGNAYLQRVRGSYAANKERAITYLTRALEAPVGEKSPVVTWCNLGIAYRDRVGGDRAANIEQAIRSFKNSLGCQDGARDPVAWASTQTHLAQAYLLRRRHSRGANAEAALGCARDAVERAEAHASGGVLASALNALGMAHLRRETGDDESNGQEAIRCLQEALALVNQKEDPSSWAKIASNLGAAYVSWTGGDTDANREIGIGYLEQASAVLDGRAADPAQAVNLWNLGVALLAPRDGDPTGHFARAATCFRLADESGEMLLGVVPRLRRHVAEAQALLKMGRGSWPEARQRLDRAFELFARGWDEAVTPEARKEMIAAASRAGAWSAVAGVAAGEHAKALERLEASRAVMLREALAYDEVQLRELPDERRQTINRTRRRIAQLRAEAGILQGQPERYLALVDEVREAGATLTAALAGSASSPQSLGIAAILAAIPDGIILIAPAATEFGSVIFVVPAGCKVFDRRHVIELPTLTAPALREQLERWLAAYSDALAVFSKRGHSPEFEQRWQAASDVLEEVLEWLGQAVMTPVLDRVEELGSVSKTVLGTPDLVILPSGDFAMLPLHAAARGHAGAKHAVLEDYAVSYTPSLHALQAARERAQRTPSGGGHQALFALVNPTGDLRFSESIEVPALRHLFPDAPRKAIRTGAAASKSALLRYARGQRYLHLSCHGRFAGLDPEASGIALAGGEWLTVREIASELELARCRWVMLAGCETAMADIGQLPDEAVGQVAAFQVAGAPCVIGSLWAVPDASAALFVTKMYEEHLCAGLAPAMALRQAALWLRELSAEELAHLVQRNDQPDAGALRFAGIGAAEPAAKYPPGGSKPFRSPLFWAAFAAWGV